VWRYNCTVHSVTVQLYCTQLEDTRILVLCHYFFLLVLDLCCVSFSTFGRLSLYPLNSRFWGLHILFVWYDLAANRTKTARFYHPYPGHYTDYDNSTSIIRDFVFLFPVLYNAKGAVWNCIHFNIILIPGLLLLINNLRSVQCLPVNGRTIDPYHLSLYICSFLSVLRCICKIAKSDCLRRSVCLSYRPSVSPLGRTWLTKDNL
jgi:hypothetical protein